MPIKLCLHLLGQSNTNHLREFSRFKTPILVCQSSSKFFPETWENKLSNAAWRRVKIYVKKKYFLLCKIFENSMLRQDAIKSRRTTRKKYPLNKNLKIKIKLLKFKNKALWGRNLVSKPKMFNQIMNYLWFKYQKDCLSPHIHWRREKL